MNPLALESSLSAVLGAAFPGTTIYTGTSFAELTPESQNIIVAVDSVTAQAVGIYTAEARVKISAPALLGSESYTAFSATLETLKATISMGYLLAHWPSQNAPSLAGSYLQNISTAQDNHCWTADLEVTLGVLD